MRAVILEWGCLSACARVVKANHCTGAHVMEPHYDHFKAGGNFQLKDPGNRISRLRSRL